jgi:hypothetical protein
MAKPKTTTPSVSYPVGKNYPPVAIKDVPNAKVPLPPKR